MNPFASMKTGTLTESGGEGRQPKHRRFWRTAAEITLLAVLLLLALVRPFLLEPFFIPSDSMLPTLHTDDRVLVNKVAYHWGEPERGEIVVFYGSASFGRPDEIYVKRVIGLPGEALRITHGQTLIEDIPIEEPYIRSRPFADYETIKIPKGSYFVMGDNRNDSRDSRFWGPIPRASLIGHGVMVFWPPSHFRLLH